MRKRSSGKKVSKVVCALLSGAVWLVMSTSATAAMEACDEGNDSQDIASLSASYDAMDGIGESGLPVVVVEMTLCDDADNKTKYRVHFDHTAPFYKDDDKNGDTETDLLDACYTTSDTGMMHRGKKDNGPGSIEVAGGTIRYEVLVSELSTDLQEGNTIYVWADTQDKGIVDRAPNTDASNGCGKPEADEEVIALLLEEPSEVCPAGVRYDDLDDGTVQDCATNLIWFKHASCLGTGNWDDSPMPAAVSAQGKIAALNGGTIPALCDEYTGTYTNWRLPTIEEFCSTATPTIGFCLQANAIDSLIDSSIGFPGPTVTNTAGDGPWVEDDAFVGVQSSFYWSGTEFDTDDAWSVNLSSGTVFDDVKTNNLFVWPVRVGQ